MEGDLPNTSHEVNDVTMDENGLEKSPNDDSLEMDEYHMLCRTCSNWFPKESVQCLEHSECPLPGDWAYDYCCSGCSDSGEDTFKWNAKSWVDVVEIAVYNLWKAKVDFPNSDATREKMYFHFKKDICKFIDLHWDHLCVSKTRTQTWHNTVSSALSSHPDSFVSGFDELQQQGYWTMKNLGNPCIGKARKKRAEQKRKRAGGRKRRSGWRGDKGKKRRTSGKARRESIVEEDQYLPMPVNKRYTPLAKYTTVVFAKENSAPQVEIKEDNLTAMNPKGYRMARASHGVSEGAWYFELEVLESAPTAHTRLGWSTNRGELQAPAGFDYYSYSYRDIEGSFFHQSRTKSHGEPYQVGDVVGCYIYLPASEDQSGEAILGEPKGSKGLEAQSASQLSAPTGNATINGEEEKPEQLLGSKIIFFLNGKQQPLAFSDIFKGTYYPAASLYMSGSVRANFGAEFKFPPVMEDPGCPQPLPCCRIPQLLAEQEATTKEEPTPAKITAPAESGDGALGLADNPPSTKNTPPSESAPSAVAFSSLGSVTPGESAPSAEVTGPDESTPSTVVDFSVQVSPKETEASAAKETIEVSEGNSTANDDNNNNNNSGGSGEDAPEGLNDSKTSSVSAEANTNE